MRLLLALTMCLGCAATKLAATQCGAKAELTAVGQQLVAAEATALACSATPATATRAAQSLEQCEEEEATAEAAKLVGDAPQAIDDALVCAAALVHDLAAQKLGAK